MLIILMIIKPWLTKKFPGILRLRGKYTVSDRIEQYGQKVRPRLINSFLNSGLPYPPSEILLLGLKQERLLDVYGKSGGDRFVKVLSYPIVAASGGGGPKMREGDMQVPEGFYRIESLNPNSLYHLSLRVNYSNEFDKRMASKEGRANLGGDIMIHGSDVSIGCLAMGDNAIEEIFILAADTKLENINVVLSPCDFRKGYAPRFFISESKWINYLHDDIANFLEIISRS